MDTRLTAIPAAGIIKGQWWENQYDTGYHKVKQVQYITMKGIVVFEGYNKLMVPHHIPLMKFLSEWKLICPVEIRAYQQPLESKPRYQILTRYPWNAPSEWCGPSSRTCVGEIITYQDRKKENIR
jgi:hypothetical protein